MVAALAGIGIGAALMATFAGRAGYLPQPPVAVPAAAADNVPFAHFVAGTGLVESSTDNIGVAAPVGGVVARVEAVEGAHVAADAVLFTLDDRSARAEVAMRAARAQVAADEVALLQARRDEELRIAEARAAAASARLAEAQRQAQAAEALVTDQAMSSEEVERRRQALTIARQLLAQEQAQLRLQQGPAGQRQVDVARGQAKEAAAALAAAQAELGRLTVVAPATGEVLRVNVRPGEYVTPGAEPAPVLLGETSTLHVRVEIDENDAPRVAAGAAAVGVLRGTRARIELRFVRLVPTLTPKRNLVGDSTERVDTRVLQALYAFQRAAAPARVGQQMDVFIEAAPLAASGVER